MNLREVLTGAVVMGPMTKGSNLPYRRLCVELGARVTVSEMTVARRLKQKRRAEFALIRRAAEEPCFAVQLAGSNPEEMGWAAALVESRGADFVDLNLGCPIDHFTRKGLGAALSRQPARIGRIVAAMVRAVDKAPVTVKIRLGWNGKSRNYLDVARAAVDAGAQAVIVHGRTRDARYRHAAEWDAIAEVASSLPVPVVGNGDLLFGQEIATARERAGCAGVMVARGALIKPWIFREAAEGYLDLSAEDRLAVYRRYVELALEHWGDDEHGRSRAKEFLVWHIGFWCRYAPRRGDGSFPTMQEREGRREGATALDGLLARADAQAHDWLADRLLATDEIVVHDAPEASGGEARSLVEAAG
jgi:tRNA-dihydrouridine synthase 3